MSTRDTETVVAGVLADAEEFALRYRPGGSRRAVVARLGVPLLAEGYAGGRGWLSWLINRGGDPEDCECVQAEIYAWGAELDALASSGAISEHTAAGAWQAARAWYRWQAEVRGWTCPVYTRYAGWEFLRPQRRRSVRVLSKVELGALLAGSRRVPGEELTAARTAALVALLVGTGVRIGEAARAMRDQLRRHRDGTGTLAIGPSKGAARRTVELPEWTVTALGRYLALRDQAPGRPAVGPEPLLARTGGRSARWRTCSTSTLSLSVRAAGSAAGIRQSVHPHLIRHSLITHLLAEGWSREYVAAWSGHAGPGGLEPYDHRARRHAVAAAVAGLVLPPSASRGALPAETPRPARADQAISRAA